MKEDETSAAAALAGNGFHISDQPVVGEKRSASSNKGQPLARESSDDLLYVVARDPKTLFLYWDLNWSRLFTRAGISARQVHLRTYRGDGSIEGTQQINPFRGHCYAEVGTAGTDYFCELGSFAGVEWKGLARSATTATPEANMSGDFSVEFATLPAHLSFQRLLDIFSATRPDRATLARSAAELQETVRLLKTGATPDDWSQLATEIAGQLNGADGGATSASDASDLSTLVEMALRGAKAAVPTVDELARLKEFANRYGGSSWTGASHGGFGGSSSA